MALLEAPAVDELVDRFTASVLAGAAGDAIGWPVEFRYWNEIVERYGLDGIDDLPAWGEVTDDTQMLIFTLEGLIRARTAQHTNGTVDTPAVLHQAYLRWLHTQDSAWTGNGPAPDGWVIDTPDLHHQRAPGNTCLGALRTGHMGRIGSPLNDSEGCGGVMRAAPAGFFADTTADAFRLGCDLAIITHGHPNGYLPAGMCAAIIAETTCGSSIRDAVEVATGLAEREEGSDELVSLSRRAATDTDPIGPRRLESYGGGWHGHEALAISIACALDATDLRTALCAAANHSGDSDSTAAITGNILGAHWGSSCLPDGWEDRLEHAALLRTLAADATALLTNPDQTVNTDWLARYPAR